MTQTVVEGKGPMEIDYKRNLVFIVFGAAYLGGFQWWIQVTQYRKWFPGNICVARPCPILTERIG